MEFTPHPPPSAQRHTRLGARLFVFAGALLYGAVELIALQRSRWRAARSR